jgi:glycerol kinase
MARPVYAGIDQGTTGTRTSLYDEAGALVATGYLRSHTDHPRADWDEQDAEALLDAIRRTLSSALADAGDVKLAAIGLANQGESVVAFDRVSGRPLSPAILWSDRRGSELVDEVAGTSGQPVLETRSGLPLDPYFSASKMAWMCRHLDSVRSAAVAGRLAISTLDGFFIHRLTEGAAYITDPSTASRTQLMNLDSRRWDGQCAAVYGLDVAILPEVAPTILPAPIETSLGAPLTATVCDQPAALAAIGGVSTREVKVTHGTGCFVEANVGAAPLRPQHGLMPIAAWELPTGDAGYAIEGGVFTAATAVNWLVDLGLAADAAHVSALATQAAGEIPLFLPGFTGVGAPWWRPGAAGVLGRLRSSTGPTEIAASVLQGIAHRVVDILEAIEAEQGLPEQVRVDGGLSASRWLLQTEADLSGLPIAAAREREGTAAGAAGFAAIGAGALSLDGMQDRAALENPVEPSIGPDERAARRREWRAFVEASRGLDPSELSGTGEVRYA